MTTNTRRKILAAGGLIAFGAGFSATAERMLKPLLGRDKSKSRYHGASLEPEFSIDPATGTLKVNPAQQVSYTMCLGCTTLCGVRVRIDRAGGKVLRVAGNPYSPLSTEPHLPMKASIRDSFVAISGFQDKGLAGRSTACGRGNAVLEQMDSPFRVLRPMKRV
ncbi:MAG: tetrathionate reductase subunit TtrA, partial [Candidatus Thermoplasmatota archaeon]|nr:tetrathionate reductase subunit TtrA [Candidatus Thermoplasmatota archaeon]